MTPEPLYADNPTARVSYDGGVTWIECDVTLNDDNGVYIDARNPTDVISAEDLFAELGLDDAATTNLVDVSSKLVVATEDAAGGD